jgi:hypothetical protein
MKLNQKALALTFGIFGAGALALISIIANGFDIWLEGVQTLAQFYIGYDITFKGAIIGALYGFLDGFIGGWLIAWLYNKLAR